MEKNSLADRFIVPPYSVIDARKGSWKERKKVWQSEIGPVANSREESLYESLAMRMPDLYVSTYEHRKQLGISFKDYVQRYVDKEVLEKEMQKMPFYGVSCFDPVLAEVIYHWFTPGPNSKIFDCFAGDITKGYVATKCGHTFSGIELRSEQVEENKVRCAELGVNAMYVQDDGRNVVNHLGCATQDLFITCPPYYDLEIYSDNANDASARQTYREFLKVIDEAITQSLISLKKNRFGVAIVSDIRDKAGAYSCFPEDIISIFRRRGCILWNDIIYLNNDSHAQIRAAQYMNRRKVVRMHQRVLVFYNGRTSAIQKYFGKISNYDTRGNQE